ncbi:alpha/beta hydrolase [Nocardia brasiliensis]|uniref:alpha/beta hydrolase n=1 Tax=Nocardia brasiliensis TaxID=37326 RepID=UPI001D01C85F|nr:alpha/beta hydrolase family protein [Nocardia brasiliensis]
MASLVIAVLATGMVLNGPIAGIAKAQGGAGVLPDADTLFAARAADGSSIVDATVLHDRHIRLRIYSAAMDSEVVLDVQRPADTATPAPVLYLFNGSDSGDRTNTWTDKTDILDFLADAHVNVVQPVGGNFSYYTDWRAPDPVLGVNKWRTFFLDEAPALLSDIFSVTGKNAAAGISMSGTSVLQLATARPGLYSAVASYSACAQISDPIGYNFVRTVVDGYGRSNTLNMYGPEGDEMWAENDPLLHAELLRGTGLFISSGNGAPGQYDFPGDDFVGSDGPDGPLRQLTIGTSLEAITAWCTRNLSDRLEQLAIPAVTDLDPDGTHSWGYWQDAFKKSWPTLAAGLGISH